MQRKTKFLGAALTAGVLALSACGSGTDPGSSSNGGNNNTDSGNGENVVLEFLFWNWGPDAQPGWESITDEFMETHEGISFKLTPVAGENWGTYLANAATMIAGGAKPDLIYTATEGVKFLILNDMIMPLDDLVEGDAEAEEILADMAPNLVDGLRSDGSLYALPYAWNNMVIYYNTERFDEAGLDYPSADWTQDDFVEIATKLTEDVDGDGRPDKYGYTWASNEMFPGIMPWVLNYGGNLASDDLCEATVDSPEAIEAVSFLAELVNEKGIAPAPAPMADIITQFENGDVAMFGAGRWPLATLLPDFEDFDVQVFPKVNEQITEFGVAGFPILSSTENPEEAWAFAKFASSLQIQERAIGSEDTPATDIPARRSVADQIVAEGLLPENSEIFYDSVDKYDAALVPAPANFSDFESTILRHVGQIMAGEVSPEQGMQDAQQELESIVTCD